MKINTDSVETMCFQASAAKKMRSALFWVITQRICYSFPSFRDNLSVQSSGLKKSKRKKKKKKKEIKEKKVK